MIELSKCPQCAADDVVNIAGKDFCMRCGTPAEDNTAMGVSEQPQVQTQPQPQVQPQSQAQQAPQPTSPIDTPSQVAATGVVQKFNTQATQVAAITDAALQSPPAQLQAEHEANDSTIKPSIMASTAPELNANPAPMEQIPSQANQSIPVSVALHAPATEPQPQPQAQAQAQAQMQPQPQVQIQPQPQPQPNVLAQQVPNFDTPAPPVAQSNFESLTLDRKASGVLSDDQFDQLKQSVSSENTITPQPSAPPANTVQQTNPVQPTNPVQQTNPVPPANPVQPTNPVQQTNPVHNTGKLAMATDVYSLANGDQASTGPSTTPEQPKAGIKKAFKPAAIAVSIAALFMTGAYIWRVNYPSLAFKIASAKAGISATMPGYVPTGYNLGSQIQTNPGSVSYALINSDANKKITVTQSKTDWDSQALAENYVAPKAENYLALQAQGLTIYVLGQNQATWVNKGTWYKIDSPDQPLNQDQIIKIATSL